MVNRVGLEPTALRLKDDRSTIELPVRKLADQAGIEPALSGIKNPSLNRSATGLQYGAHGRTRTYILQIRNLALIHLSYARELASPHGIEP